MNALLESAQIHQTIRLLYQILKYIKTNSTKKKIEKNASRMQSNAIFGLYIAAWLAL